MRQGAALRVAAAARVVAVPRHPHQRRQLRGGGAQRAGQLGLKHDIFMSKIFVISYKNIYGVLCGSAAGGAVGPGDHGAGARHADSWALHGHGSQGYTQYI